MSADRSNRTMSRVLMVAFGAAMASQVYTQVVNRDHTLALAKKTSRFTVSKPEFARRGTIFSSDHKVLAQSADKFQLSLSYAKVPESPSFFLDLSKASGIPAAELEAPAFAKEKAKVWNTPVTSEQAKAISAVKTYWRADGVSLKRMMSREYPLADVTDPIVGQLDPDLNPTGIESSQNHVLAGIDGLREGLVDRNGAFLPMRMTPGDRRALDGEDITLTLDSAVQVEATAALRRAVELNRAAQGTAIVMETATGRLLAAASWVKNQEKDGFNGFTPVTMAKFPPGSTFKILTLAVGLQLSVIDPTTVINCTGQTKVADRYMHCPHGAHGPVDAREAISRSCNVSAAQWALKIGHANLAKFYKSAGLLDPTNIGLPGEVKGSYALRDNERVQAANWGFGQAIALSPIELITAFNAIANEGVEVPARLIDKVGDHTEPYGKPKRIFNEGVSDQIVDFMVSTFADEAGTAHNLRIPGYTLAGKTGTAQKIEAEGHHYVSNFVGMIPANHPQVTVLVMIDDPTAGNIYGGTVAGPVFKDIANLIIKRFNLPRDGQSR